MPYIVLIVLLVIAGGYFTFRYFSLLYALKELTEEATDVRKDITQNHILHLPVPNRQLGKLLSAFNAILEDVRSERQSYVRREKEFKQQIENISHDLRTPLTVILGYLKLIRQSDSSEAKEDRELTEAITVIEHKAEIMKHLVTQFYDYSRLDAGDYTFTLEEVDVVRTLREALLGNYQMLEEARLKVQLTIPEHPVWVMGNIAALERVFLNLLQNAARYADTYLTVSIKEGEQRAVVSFSNDTKKLSKEDIPHLFDRFYMQDNARNQGGSGLGLTVAKTLAEEMKAALTAAALEGGICFELCMEAVQKWR